MEYFNNEICVTYEELTSGDDPVISYQTLRKNITRGNIKTAHRGGGEGSRAKILYSSLPEKYKARFVDKRGDPVEILKEQRMRDGVKTDEKARAFYEGYRYEMNGVETSLSDKLIAEYTLNASVLNALVHDLEDKITNEEDAGQQPRHRLGMRRRHQREPARNIRAHPPGEPLAPEGENQPLQERGLHIPDFRQGRQCQHAEDNRGGRQVLDSAETQPRTGLQRFAHIRGIQPHGTGKGMEAIEEQARLAMWFNRPDVQQLWWDAVHGEMSSHQRFGRKHRTQLPGKRDALWYGDGTKLNPYYMDGDGNMRTTMVYEVVDAYSEVLLGYHISGRGKLRGAI